MPCPDIIHVMWHCAIVKECPDSWNLTLQPCWRMMHQLMLIHAHEVRLPGGKDREEMMCPVSTEQWQQRAVATQTAQATGTTRGQVCANQALCMQMHVLVPKRQTWEHVSHGRHQAGKQHQPDGVPPCRRRPWMIDHAVATGNQHHGVIERVASDTSCSVLRVQLTRTTKWTDSILCMLQTLRHHFFEK